MEMLTGLEVKFLFNLQHTSKSQFQSKSEHKIKKQDKINSEDSGDDFLDKDAESKISKTEIEFDYKLILEKSLKKLEQIRKSTNKPFGINEMSISQLREEKSLLKKELQSFETLYQTTFGVQVNISL